MASSRKPAQGPAERATRADIAKMPPDVAKSGLAATAIVLARGLDSGASLAMQSMAAKTHMEIMDRLRELAPPERQEDSVDAIRNDLAERRAKRAGGAKAPA